ncbi:MAG: hypothetical protein U5R14_06345 [Gemmatimonadota bacterium]|nr:hypothetical protein [Gemmatimonadota bacterium]
MRPLGVGALVGAVAIWMAVGPAFAQSGYEGAEAGPRPDTLTARSTAWWLRWGPERPDLLRYNRVEGLSVGVRAGVRPYAFGRGLPVTTTVRLGTADRTPSFRLAIERPSLRRALSVAFYDELSTTEQGARHFGPLNSLTSALAGRDAGDYYRRTGVRFAWEPPPTEHPTYGVAIHSERHASVSAETRASLARLWHGDGWAFRPNVAAEEGWEHALTVAWTPWWGRDRRSVRGGVRTVAAAALGDLRHVRAAVLGRLVLPIPGGMRVAFAAGGGGASEEVPLQRSFAVGGPSTLRGYPSRVRVGPCHARARVELERTVAPGAVVAFWDGAWAGACDAWSEASPLRSVGIGVALVDGFVRADLVRALDAPGAVRLEVYVDDPPYR